MPRTPRRRTVCTVRARPGQRTETTMTTEQNKALYRRWFEQVATAGDLELADELLTADYVLHFPGMPGPVDRQTHKDLVDMFRAGFPDWTETLEDVIAEDDRVVARIVGRGTHLGEFQGIPATGRRVEAHGMGIARITNGRIAEMWAAYDALGLMQQLGALPAPTPA